MTSTWQLKEVGSQSSLSGQTKVDESQDPARGEKWRTAYQHAWLRTNTHGRAEQMICSPKLCSPKHKFHLSGWSPFWLPNRVVGIILKKKKNGVWWLDIEPCDLLSLVSKLHIRWNGDARRQRWQGLHIKEILGCRYRYSNWHHQWPFVIGYEAQIWQSDELDLEECRGSKARAWFIDLEECIRQTWAWQRFLKN